MICLELLQNIHLLLLITSWFPHLLLPLIKHHLLDHLPRIAVQIAQRTVLGRDFRDVNFWGRGDDVGPPF